MIAVRLTGPLRIIAVASPRYLADHPPLLTPRDLRLHNCVQYRRPWDDVINRWSFEKDGEHLDVAVEGTLIVNEIDLALKAALDGVGVAYVIEARALPFISNGGLVPLLEDWSPSLSGFFLYYSSRRQLPPHLKRSSTSCASSETAVLSCHCWSQRQRRRSRVTRYMRDRRCEARDFKRDVARGRLPTSAERRRPERRSLPSPCDPATNHRRECD